MLFPGIFTASSVGSARSEGATAGHRVGGESKGRPGCSPERIYCYYFLSGDIGDGL